MKNNQKISIIIPIYNGLEYTKKCLKFLYESINNSSIGSNISIIVVDDGSIDGSADWIKNNYSEVIILSGNGNLWWSGAVNLGTKYALNTLNSDYVLLWNNDIKPCTDYFKNLCEILEKNPKETIICSKIFYLDKPDVIWSMGGIFNTKTGVHKMIGVNQIDNEKFSSRIAVDWNTGMGTLIPKIVFKKIGFFDERTFPQYHGDADFTLRAKKNGFKILAYPNLKIWNDISSTGIQKKDFRSFIKSFYSIKSHNNIIKNIKFYHRHCTSYIAYCELFKKYFCFIGGFFKWKVLNLLGVKKPLLNRTAEKECACMVRTDCKYYRGNIPCKPHKESEIHCDNCKMYEPLSKRILIIKLGAAGDVIRTTPILRKLRIEFPNSEIVWLTYFPDLLPRSWVNKILDFELKNIVWLQNQKFNWLINLDKDDEAIALATIIMADRKSGFFWNMEDY